MKLYAFDAIDSSLDLVPLAARRALDALGIKLSLDAFRSLSLENRQLLAEAGSSVVVDTEKAKYAIVSAKPPGKTTEVMLDPPEAAVPQEVTEVLGSKRPLPEKVWQNLSHLDRYVLVKVIRKNRAERVEGAYQEIVGQSGFSTHLRPQGGVHMVSVSKKAISLRRAKAECWVTTTQEAFNRLHGSSSPKGDVLGTARLAGIMATKRTSDLIPLCHPIGLNHADIDFEEYPESAKIRVLCSVEVEARTGVEMEAMVGANLAALTIYDMLKSIDRGMCIGPTRLLEKTGGRSGSFVADSTSSESPKQ